MHVMADLSRSDEPVIAGSADTETPLCTVTYDKARKLLTISPDFTHGDADEHYNVTNSYGIKFNYRIEHVSEGPTQQQLQERREDARRVSMCIWTHNVCNRHSGCSRTASPPRSKKTVFSWKKQSRTPPRPFVRRARGAVAFYNSSIFSALTHLSFSLFLFFIFEVTF